MAPPGTDTVLITPTIKVNGSALDDAWLHDLIDLRVERAFQVPPISSRGPSGSRFR